MRTFLAVAIIAAVLALVAYRFGSESFASPTAQEVPSVNVVNDRGQNVPLRSVLPNTIVVFGYTRCHDACPLVLSRVVTEGRQVVFVTVDPVYDRPSVLSAYLRAWPGVVGITAPAATIERIYAAFTGSTALATPDDHTTQPFEVDHWNTILPLSR